MINPIEVNPLTLPSVSLEERMKLPCIPCVYFAIDSQGQIQYIGRSTNPRRRFQAHNKGFELGKMLDVRIAYLETDIDLLSEIEQALINWFQPPLNKLKRTMSDPDCGYVGEIPMSRIAELRSKVGLTRARVS